MFVLSEEELEDGELRVTVLGSGNPWVTRGQASGSVLVEVGNPERDLFVLDLGSGCLANYASLKLPVNKLDKVFFTHLHADHTRRPDHALGQLLEGGTGGPGYRRVGPQRDRAAPGDAALRRSDPGSTRLGHRRLTWADQPGQPRDDGDRVRLQPDARRLPGERRHGDGVPRRPRAQRRGRLPLRLRRSDVRPLGRHPRRVAARACLRRRYRPAHPRVCPAGRRARGRVGSSIERATMALNAAHTSPQAAGKVFGLVRPRMAGLWHTLLSHQVIQLIFSELGKVYDGPVVQTQDLTVFNVTKDAVAPAKRGWWTSCHRFPASRAWPTPPSRRRRPTGGQRHSSLSTTPSHPPDALLPAGRFQDEPITRVFTTLAVVALAGLLVNGWPGPNQGGRHSLLHVGAGAWGGLQRGKGPKRKWSPSRTVSSPERPRAWIGVSELGHEG